jgi:hypothetical protein
MKPRCQHSPQFVRAEPNGEDRIIRHYRCRHCGKESRRNLKKPRFVPYAEALDKQAARQRKTAKDAPRAKCVRKKAIPAMSMEKREWDAKYKAKHRSDPDEVLAWDGVPKADGTIFLVCFRGRKSMLERHHVFRRWGRLIMLYRYVTRRLHAWIEANSKKAREKGLLFDVVRGELRNPSKHDPFGILPEFAAS